MKNLHISCNTVNCKIVRHFGNERVAMAASSVLASLMLSRVLKHGGQVGHTSSEIQELHRPVIGR